MKKVVFPCLLLLTLTSARAATLLGVNLSIPVAKLPSCDSSKPPCLHAIAPDVYTLKVPSRPSWARGVITVTTVKGHIAQVFIESRSPVRLPAGGPLTDRVKIHTKDRWVYSDGAVATYVAKMPRAQTSDISIAVVPAPVTVAGQPRMPAQ